MTDFSEEHSRVKTTKIPVETMKQLTYGTEEIPDMSDDAVLITEDERGAIPQQVYDINEVTTKRIVIGVRTLAGIESNEFEGEPTLVEPVMKIERGA